MSCLRPGVIKQHFTEPTTGAQVQQGSSSPISVFQVIIHGHVPPGTLARAPLQWYRPHQNTQLADLLKEYGDVVTAAIFGHEHTDSFRVVMHDNSKSCAGTNNHKHLFNFSTVTYLIHFAPLPKIYGHEI